MENDRIRADAKTYLSEGQRWEADQTGLNLTQASLDSLEYGDTPLPSKEQLQRILEDLHPSEDDEVDEISASIIL